MKGKLTKKETGYINSIDKCFTIQICGRFMDFSLTVFPSIHICYRYFFKFDSTKYYVILKQQQKKTARGPCIEANICYKKLRPRNLAT